MLEVYVSAEKSELYQNVEMEISSVRFFQDSGAGVTSPLPNRGITLNFKEGGAPILVYDKSTLESEFERFGFGISSLQVTTLDGDNIKVVDVFQNFDHYFVYEMLKNKKYRMDVIIDFDLAIINEPGTTSSFQFYPNIKIEEI